MEPVADDLERQEVADALVASHVELLEVEARQFVLAAQWADLHPMSSGTVLPGTERAKRYGGEGTPFAGEFAAAELGVLLGRSHVAAATLMADALDVRHRLPMLWAALTAGRVRVWQARHVAARTRATGLSLAQAREMDVATTPHLASLSWGRFTDGGGAEPVRHHRSVHRARIEDPGGESDRGRGDLPGRDGGPDRRDPAPAG
jgi:hypothetical protein